MKEQFINCYPLSKTLQFSLIPVGKTEDNFNKNLLLEKDKQRAKNYEKVKGYIDRFHKEYIESVLSKARIEKVNEYADLYWKSNKDDSDTKAMESLENNMRKQISAWKRAYMWRLAGFFNRWKWERNSWMLQKLYDVFQRL